VISGIAGSNTADRLLCSLCVVSVAASATNLSPAHRIPCVCACVSNYHLENSTMWLA